MKPGILVLDDAAILRPVLVQMLEQVGFRVWQTDDGLEAINLYERHHKEINLVLLEAAIGPDPDGVDILTRLRRVNPAVRCYFMNNNPWLYDEAALLERGAEWVFQKPFTPNDVASMLWAVAGTPPTKSQLTTSTVPPP